MAIKVPITTYRNNPAATFWSRLGTFLSYLSPLVIFGMLFVPLSFSNHGRMGTVLWVLWGILSVGVGIAYFLVTMLLCTVMEQKALRKGKDQFPGRSGASVHPGASPVPPQSLHPSLQKREGQESREDWEETTLL